MALEVLRLIGVYDADGSVRGELSYLVRSLVGRAHCALCDITHGALRERADWRRERASFGVAFDTYHADDQPHDVRDAAAGTAPVVLAEISSGLVVLLDRSALEECEASPERLVAAVRAAAVREGLHLPGSSC